MTFLLIILSGVKSLIKKEKKRNINIICIHIIEIDKLKIQIEKKSIIFFSFFFSHSLCNYKTAKNKNKQK